MRLYYYSYHSWAALSIRIYCGFIGYFSQIVCYQNKKRWKSYPAGSPPERVVAELVHRLCERHVPPANERDVPHRMLAERDLPERSAAHVLKDEIHRGRVGLPVLAQLVAE